jgi:hypothetical protein
MVNAIGPQPAPFRRCFLGLRRSSLAVISINRSSRHLIVWASQCLIDLGAYDEARRVIAQGIAIGKAKPTLLRLNVINDSLESTGHN